jgi:fatty acid amide hydrolase 2
MSDPGPLGSASGVALARLVRERARTSRELVEHHIAAIERVNPRLNAVVRTRFDEARREADAADARTRSAAPGELPPLHGVPCTIKECFALAGMPQTGGLVRRRRQVATSDATGVARMRGAGAIPLGVTNVSEGCMWMESNNYVYGRTNNPYDAARTVGGSSGGEAAIIGAGASPFGLGSDVGGSIRGPAFFNGVFGHKPTGGLVPGTGQYPVSSPRARRILTTGPLARRAEDLMPLLRILAGPDGEDPGCTAIALGDPAAVDLRGLTVLDVPDDGRLGVSDELRAAQERAASALSARGARVRTMRFRELRQQFEIWSAILGAAEEVPFGVILGGEEGARVRPWRELPRWAMRRSDHTLMALLLAAVDPLPHALPKLSERTRAAGARLRAAILDALGPRGVMLYPVYPTTAPKHDAPVHDYLRLRFPSGYQGVFNVLELPATAVPLGLGRGGLPLGLQVVGPSGGDHLTIATALALEDALGGWVPPPALRRPAA